MVHFLTLILSLFISVFAQAAYSPACGPGTTTVAGRCLSNTGLIILNIQNQGGSGTMSTGFKIDPVAGGAPAAYVVPASTEFIVYAVSCDQITASSTSTLPQRLAYADDSGTDFSPTNPVGAITGTASTALSDTIYGPQIAGGQTATKEVAIYGRVPTGKYVGIYNNTASQLSVCRIYGYEIIP